MPTGHAWKFTQIVSIALLALVFALGAFQAFAGGSAELMAPALEQSVAD